MRLDPGTTKNDEGRVVYLTPELVRLLGEQLERIRAVERKTGRIIPYLFPYLQAAPSRAAPPRFPEGVDDGCGRPACPGMLRHDFRRTAVRNLVNAGVPERVAMSITGTRRAACSTATTSSARPTFRPHRDGWPRPTGTFPGTFGQRRLTAPHVTLQNDGREALAQPGRAPAF